MICNSCYQAHTSSVFKELRIFKFVAINMINIYNTTIFIYNYEHTHLPQCLDSMFKQEHFFIKKFITLYMF